MTTIFISVFFGPLLTFVTAVLLVSIYEFWRF